MSDWAIYVFLFLGGVVYIALDTVRLLIVSRGRRLAAALIGIAEVIVFLSAVSKILSGPFAWGEAAAYALGFGGGTWLGSVIEEKMAVGLVLVRLITQRDCKPLLEALKEKGYGVTNVAANGQTEKRRIVFSVVKRKDLKPLLKLVEQHNPNAFIAIEDVRAIKEARQQDIIAITP